MKEKGEYPQSTRFQLPNHVNRTELHIKQEGISIFEQVFGNFQLFAAVKALIPNTTHLFHKAPLTVPKKICMLYY